MPSPIVISTRVTLDIQPMLAGIAALNNSFFAKVGPIADTATKHLKAKLGKTDPRPKYWGRRTPDAAGKRGREAATYAPTGWTPLGVPVLYTWTGRLQAGIQVEKESRGIGQYAGGHKGGVSFRIRMPDAASYFIFHESMAARGKMPYRPVAAPVAEWARIELMKVASQHYGQPIGRIASVSSPSFRPVSRPPGAWESLRPIGTDFSPQTLEGGPTGLWGRDQGLGI